jgi:hypothetical protein
MTMVGGTFGVTLVGGFESRDEFWLFLLFCAIFAFPATLVWEYLWPSQRP